MTFPHLRALVQAAVAPDVWSSVFACGEWVEQEGNTFDPLAWSGKMCAIRVPVTPADGSFRVQVEMVEVAELTGGATPGQVHIEQARVDSYIALVAEEVGGHSRLWLTVDGGASRIELDPADVATNSRLVRALTGATGRDGPDLIQSAPVVDERFRRLLERPDEQAADGTTTTIEEDTQTQAAVSEAAMPGRQGDLLKVTVLKVEPLRQGTILHFENETAGTREMICLPDEMVRSLGIEQGDRLYMGLWKREGK